VDIAALALVDTIADGEVAQDVGPQLTPRGEHVTMSYDEAGRLLELELWQVSRILRPETIRTGALRVTHDPDGDEAVLHLAAVDDDDEVIESGGQLTPTGDRLRFCYDAEHYLVRVHVDGCSRVLRPETLAPPG